MAVKKGNDQLPWEGDGNDKEATKASKEANAKKEETGKGKASAKGNRARRNKASSNPLGDGGTGAGVDKLRLVVGQKIKSLHELPATNEYLKRIGAEARSLRTAVVKQSFRNYWKDIAVLHFAQDGTVSGPDNYLPSSDEQEAICTEFSRSKFPRMLEIPQLINPPPEISKAKREDVFFFRGEDGNIIFVQVRIALPEGKKAYVPWTYWDDNEWRMMEPEGKLPLYNLERLKEASTVFIHEGAKSARFIQDMIDQKTDETKARFNAHPFSQELSNAAHVGWIGGAMNPGRTDWSIIAKHGIKRAYIIADNDEAGISALREISVHLKMPTYCLQFTDQWPRSYDLADPIPDAMFDHIEEQKVYVGPSFMSMLSPATWATDIWQPPKGKPVHVLRDSFLSVWYYVVESNSFVCADLPQRYNLPDTIFNSTVAPFSHMRETSRLLTSNQNRHLTRLAYRPDIAGRIISTDHGSAINLHMPTTIKPRKGDPAMWLSFLEYLIKDGVERRHVERWCATLIAKPDTRMSYGLLLVSEKQGVGKTTLASYILAPLMGEGNVSYPSESDIMSDYNGWCASKRLVIISEIYSGGSWKAYNALKSIITDKNIQVNQKYQRQYQTDNWAHVLASSNSPRALKMENDDRRWFYPEVTEEPWSAEKFVAFRQWLHAGGLGIIYQWALDFDGYVMEWERAPMTAKKKTMIEDSRSEAQTEAAELARAMLDTEEPVAVATHDVEAWLRSNAQGKVYDSGYQIRKAMLDVGVKLLKEPERVKVGGRMQYIILNSPAMLSFEKANRELADPKTDKKRRDVLLDEIVTKVRGYLKKPSEILESRM